MSKNQIVKVILRVGEILLGLYASFYFIATFMESFTAYLVEPLPPEEKAISQMVMKGYVIHMIIPIICIAVLEFIFNSVKTQNINPTSN